MLVFEERERPEYPEINLAVQSREPTKLYQHMTPSLGIEPRPHWWEASALTTAPALHPNVRILLGTLCWWSSLESPWIT